MMTCTVRNWVWTAAVLFWIPMGTHAVAEDTVSQWLKGERYQQSTNGAPEFMTVSPFQFFFRTPTPISFGSSTKPNLKLPSGEIVNLVVKKGTTSLELAEDFPTELAMNSRYGFGNFIYTAPGLITPLVQSFYVESANFPSIPEIRNPKELQKIKYNGTFLVEWFPFAGRDQFDSIRFEVFDGQKIIWDTGDWNAAAPLAGSETETEVPSSVLVPGKEYRGVLRFERIPLFENGAPSAPGKRIGFWRETQFSLRRLPKLPPISETGEVCPPKEASSGFRVIKQLTFNQVAESEWVPVAGNEASFVAEAFQTGAHLFDAVDLEIPGVLEPRMLKPSGSGLSILDRFASQAELDSNYPGGSYFVSFSTSDGDLSREMPIPVQWPEMPRFLGFTNAQNASTNSDFRLEWNVATPPDTAAELVVLNESTGEVLLAAGGCYPTPLTTNSIAIPTTQLKIGTPLRANLSVTRYTVRGGTVGDIENGLAGASISTSMTFRVSASANPIVPVDPGVVPSQIQVLETRLTSTGILELALIVSQQASLKVEVAPSVTGPWLPAVVTRDPEDPKRFRVPIGTLGDKGFFRLISIPSGN